MDTYCVYCREKTQPLDPAYIITCNGKLQLQARCGVCEKTKSTFLKQGNGVFNTLLNKLPLPEIHLRLPKDVLTEQVPAGDFNNTGTYSFCGPFTKLEKRLQQGYTGVNNLDRACLQHDIAYNQNSDTNNRNIADDILAKAAMDIANDVNAPAYERQQGRTVAAIMAAKSRFGLGIKPKKQVKFVEQHDFSDALAEELHRGLRRKFQRRRVQVFGVDEIWSADLVDMQYFSKNNDGFRYLLTVIDVLSKFAWAVPLKDKTGKSVATAFEKIVKESDRKPMKLWVDKGTEFYNNVMDQFLRENKIDRYSSESEFKAAVVERFNRTLKTNMYKYFTAKNTFRYVDVLDKLLHKYNSTKHNTIGMTPTEASKPENETKVFNRLNLETVRTKVKPKFSVGDRVRITKYKTVFDKGYLPNWTEEVFLISEVKSTIPVTYKIKDLQDEPVLGSFYERQLQKANQEVYRIEKVIRRRTKNGIKEVYVKWRGYPDKFNQWISESDVQDL